MAFGARSARGTQGERASDTSHVVTVANGNVTVGSILVSTWVTDNLATVDGTSNNHSQVVDSKGNTWTKAWERTESSGAAADGLCVSQWFTKVTTQLVSGTDTVTLTTSAAVTSKAVGLFQTSVGAGNTMQLESVGFGHDAASASLAGLTNTEKLLVGVHAGENEDVTITEDADYVEAHNEAISSTTGATDTNVVVHVGTRVATLTGDTYTVTGVGALNLLTVLAAYIEVAPGATGSGAVTLDAFTSSGAGAQTFVGSGAPTLDAFAAAGSGTVANPVSGSGTPTLADFVAAGAGLETLSGSGAATLGDFAAAGVAAETMSGSGSPVLADFLASGAGIVANPVSGSGAPSLDDFVAAGAGEESIPGSGAPVLDDFAASGSGLVANPVSGSGAPVLGDLVASGAGAETFAGSGASSLDDFTASGSGSVANPVTGSGAITLDEFASAGSGSLIVSGSGAPVLDDFTASGSGIFGDAIGGSGTPALDDFSASGVGEVVISGSGAAALGDVLAAGVGTVLEGVSGSGALELEDFLAAGSGTVVSGISGSGAITLGPFVAAGSGTIPTALARPLGATLVDASSVAALTDLDAEADLDGGRSASLTDSGRSGR